MLLIYVAIALAGLLICVRQVWPRAPVVSVGSSPPILERLAVFLNGALAIIALVGVLVALVRSERVEPGFVAVFSMLLLLVASPLILWKSRWRPFAEGAAIAALGIFMILSGFSIGIYFLPFALLMLLGAAQGLRAREAGVTV